MAKKKKSRNHLNICTRCGNEYKGYFRSQKYCQDCREFGAVLDKRAYMKEYRKKQLVKKHLMAEKQALLRRQSAAIIKSQQQQIDLLIEEVRQLKERIHAYEVIKASAVQYSSVNDYLHNKKNSFYERKYQFSKKTDTV